MEIFKRAHILGSEIYQDAKAELEKNRKPNCCIICGIPLKNRRWKYCTDECRINWFKQFKPYFLWGEIRLKALERDNFTCVKCGFRDEESKIYHTGKLIADHIKPIALGGEEFELINLQTLCEKCNRTKTNEDLRLIMKLKFPKPPEEEIKKNRKLTEFISILKENI
jgi:5-methylcytosine-specific restriction endonuclease McrA